MPTRRKNLKQVETLLKENLDLVKNVQSEIPDGSDYVYGSKNTAALRRRSMDLSRALSDLRRP